MTELLPCTVEVARAVVAGSAVPVLHVADWPHADTADALRPLAEHPDDCGPGTFLVVEDGLVVGDCGWLGPGGTVDVGYGVAPSVRGRGVGTRAVALLLEWVTAQGAEQVRAEVRSGNEPSLRLLAGLGFTDVGEHAGHRVLLRPCRREVDHTR